MGRRENGEKAVRLAEELHPDVVLMDLRMPRMDGVEATRRILATGRPARVLVLTTYADDDSVFAALQAGALGYLTKDSGADDIALAVRTVHAGKALLGAGVQRRLLELSRGRGSAKPEPETRSAAPPPPTDSRSGRWTSLCSSPTASRTMRSPNDSS